MDIRHPVKVGVSLADYSTDAPGHTSRFSATGIMWPDEIIETTLVRLLGLGEDTSIEVFPRYGSGGEWQVPSTGQYGQYSVWPRLLHSSTS